MPLNITLRAATAADYDFAFEVKKQAMRVTIESKWGWDDAFQLGIHEQRWGEKPWFIIESEGQLIGTVPLHK